MSIHKHDFIHNRYAFLYEMRIYDLMQLNHKSCYAMRDIFADTHSLL